MAFSSCFLLWPAIISAGGPFPADGPGRAVSAVVTLRGRSRRRACCSTFRPGPDLVGVGVRVAGEPDNRACGLCALDGHCHAVHVGPAGGDQLRGRLGFRGGAAVLGTGPRCQRWLRRRSRWRAGRPVPRRPGRPWTCPARPGGPRTPPRRPACPAARRGVRPRCRRCRRAG